MGLPTTERDTKSFGPVRRVKYKAAVDTFKSGVPIGMGKDDGYVKNLSGTNEVTPLGICGETKTTTVAGAEYIDVLFGDFFLANSTVNTVSGSHAGRLVAAELTDNNYTVGMDFAGFEVMGRCSFVDATNGPCVRMDPATTPISGSGNGGQW